MKINHVGNDGIFDESVVYRVYMVTYATEFSKKGFCIMAASAEAHGFKLNVLGEGRQTLYDETESNERLWVVKDFVESAKRSIDPEKVMQQMFIGTLHCNPRCSRTSESKL